MKTPHILARLAHLVFLPVLLLLATPYAHSQPEREPTLFFLSEGESGTGRIVLDFSTEVSPHTSSDLSGDFAPRMTPPILGTWSWQDSTRLVFKADAPHLDFLPLKKYTIDFSQVKLRPGKSIPKYPLQITLPPLQLTLVECSWREAQGSTPPTRAFHAVIATNYPVGAGSPDTQPLLQLQRSTSVPASLAYSSNPRDYRLFGFRLGIEGTPMVIPPEDTTIQGSLPPGSLTLYDKVGPTVSHAGTPTCSLPVKRIDWTSLEDRTRTRVTAISGGLGTPPSDKPLHIPLRVDLLQDKSTLSIRGPNGKEATEGLTMTPPHPGTWTYGSSEALIFTPEAPLTPGTTFTVTLSKFPSVEIATPVTTTFTVPPPAITLDDIELYTDPSNPRMKRVTATVNLSYPFMKGSLEAHTGMSMRIEPEKHHSQQLEFEVRYDDKNPSRAYLRSAPFPVPAEPGEARISLYPGIQASTGGVGPSTAPTATIPIPSQSQVLQVTSATSSSLILPDGGVERILELATSTPVDDTQGLLAHLDMRLLPDCGAPVSTRHPLCKEKEVESWSDPKEVDSRVEAASTKLPATFKSSDKPQQMKHLFSFSAPEKRQVLVRVTSGATARGGFTLAKDARFVLEIGALARELRIMHDGSLLSLSGDKKLGLTSRGVSDIRVGLRRIPPHNISHFAGLSDGKFTNPSLSIDLDSLAEEISYDASIPGEGRNEKGAATAELKRRYAFVDFSKFMSHGAPPRGLFMLTVRSKADLPSPPDVSSLDEREAERQRKLYAEQIKRVESCSGESSTQASNEEEECEGEECSEGPESDSNESQPALCDQRLVLLTDLGLLVKRGANNEQDIYVMSFRSGKPVADAKVSLLGKNGVALFTATTPPDGHVHLPSANTFINERTPTTYIVEKDADLSFLPYDRSDRQLNVSRFDTGGVQNMEEFNSLQGYLFTDRGIYRPGEQVRLGMIVRKKGWETLPQGLPLELSIIDSRDKEVVKRAIAFDPTGFSEFKWDTPAGGATGTYRAQLHLMKAKSSDRLAQLGGTSFRVDEFQPDRVNVKAEIVSPAPATGSRPFISQADAKGRITVRNLFGSPSVGAKTTAEILVRPWSGLLAQYPGYQFRRTAKQDLPTSAEKLGEQLTSESGESLFELGLERYDEPVFEFTLTGEGFEKGSGRSVVATASLIASSLNELVGFKPDGSLSFIPKDSQRSVSLIAVATTGEQVKVEGLTAELFEDIYESTLVKQPNGLYAYQSVDKAVSRGTTSLTIDAKGSPFPLTTKEPGRFRIVISNSEKRELLTFSYNVAGEGNVTKSLERNAELTLTLNKAQYAPGDEMTLNIVSPYTGAGLITVESDRVHSQQWFTTSSTSSSHTIVVPKDLKGNAYVSVAFVRSLDSAEIFMSPLSHGVVPFKVSRAQFESKVTVDAPHEVVPGTDLPVTITVPSKTKALLFAVDEGILQFARYKNPQPLDHFFRKRALQVDTFQILDLILPDYEMVQKTSSSGGDEDSGAGKFRNPFARKQKAPVAFWSGIQELDAGKHQIAVPIPAYFSGSVRILAVVVNAEQIGTAVAASVAKGPYIILPQQPYAVAPGDEFEVGALIGNNSKGSGVAVSLSAPHGVTVVSENPVKLDLAPGRDAPIRFRVKAGDSLGPVTLGYTAAGDAASFSLTEEMSIRPAQPFMVRNSQGKLSIDEQRAMKQREFSSQRSLYNEFRDVQVSVSSTPFGLLRGLVRYLKEYPYGCTEQVVSQAFPALILAGNDELGFSQADKEKFVQRAIKTLASRQQDNGGFGLWQRTDTGNPFYSVYATHLLVTARKLGVEVPEFMYDEALRYLKEFTDNLKISWADHRAQSYALYVLSISGEVVTDKAKRLENELVRQWGSRSSEEPWVRFFLASTYKVLHLDAEAQRLYGEFAAEWRRTKILPWNVSSDPAVLGLFLYLTHEHFQDAVHDKAFEGYLWELSQEMLKGRPNSFSGSFALLGLGRFWEQFGAGKIGSFTLTERHGKDAPSPLALAGTAVKRAPIDHDNATLTLSGDGSLQLYYQLSETGYDRDASSAEIANGITLTRRILNDSGVEASSFALTDRLVYELTLNPSHPVSDLAVVAILPGGFEIDLSDEGLGQRQSLKVSGEEWKPQHIEIQEDRVMFFGAIGSTAEKFAFALKPLTKGRYQVPPLYAEGMYDPEVQFRGRSASVEVVEK